MDLDTLALLCSFQLLCRDTSHCDGSLPFGLNNMLNGTCPRPYVTGSPSERPKTSHLYNSKTLSGVLLPPFSELQLPCGTAQEYQAQVHFFLSRLEPGARRQRHSGQELRLPRKQRKHCAARTTKGNLQGSNLTFTFQHDPTTRLAGASSGPWPEEGVWGTKTQGAAGNASGGARECVYFRGRVLLKAHVS